MLFQNSSRLKSVNLAWNGLGDEGALATADCIRNNHLIHTIDISCNRITTDGAYILSKGLEANETLQRLAVSCKLLNGGFVLLELGDNQPDV